jgi:hypothetical protein
MTYATEKERIEARRMSRRKGHSRTNFYPETRAPRVDLSTMTLEEQAEHKKQKDREKCARWNARNPGKSRGALRTRRGEYPWYQSLLAAGNRAHFKGLEHDLTKEWAERTFTGYCSLTGLPFINRAQGPAGKSGGVAYSPSIDRINPLKGYTQDNCRWVLFAVNSLKGTMTDAEMYHIAAALLAKRALPLC